MLRNIFYCCGWQFDRKRYVKPETLCLDLPVYEQFLCKLLCFLLRFLCKMMSVRNKNDKVLEKNEKIKNKKSKNTTDELFLNNIGYKSQLVAAGI